MDEACGTRGGLEKCIQNFVGKPERKRPYDFINCGEFLDWLSDC
jgi:hypothetical protein